ncbi:MAG TPA: ABC transporter ATP-binding protein [Luteimonas sp.]|nr:ABC transporter ATP-binding protein [Luteimonas sp.]
MTPTPPLASLRGACKSYGAVLALGDVDLALHAGEVLALLGVNGAGKSTAIGLLLGTVRADAGHVELLGQPPQVLAARRGAGVMLQTAAVPDTLRVGEALDLTRSYYADPLPTAECVQLAGLEGLLRRPYGMLSGGQQRRVQFALAVCGRPRVLFLDEPSTGLDVGARERLWQAIRALVADGCAVLLTTHYLEEAEALADRVVVLHEGRVAAAGRIGDICARIVQRRIQCTTTLAADAVRGWPGVRSVEPARNGLSVVADDGERVVRRLLAEDPALGDLEVCRAGLAEVFVALTADGGLDGGGGAVAAPAAFGAGPATASRGAPRVGEAA